MDSQNLSAAKAADLDYLGKLAGVRRSAVLEVCEECGYTNGNHQVGRGVSCSRSRNPCGEILLDEGYVEDIEDYDLAVRYPTVQIGDDPVWTETAAVAVGLTLGLLIEAQ